MRRNRLAAMAALLCALAASVAVAATPAAAEGLMAFPISDGYLEFPAVEEHGARDEFTWRVNLTQSQSLRQVSETEAWVEDGSGSQPLMIKAEGAEDRARASVPVTLLVSEGDLVTLVVHDREGNPAAGGAPFAYPVVATTSWTGPEVTPVFIKGPPDQTEIAEERLAAQRAKEAQEAAAAAGATPSAPAPATEPPSPTCTVPSLHGLALRAAKAKLRADHCGVGQVYLARGATTGKGKVVKQFHSPGLQLTAGTPVALKLGAR